MLNEKKNYFMERWLQINIHLSKLKWPRKYYTYIKNIYIYKNTNLTHGTQGRKNKVLKRPLNLTGMTKVPILGKCPGQRADRCPPTHDTMLISFSSFYNLLCIYKKKYI